MQDSHNRTAEPRNYGRDDDPLMNDTHAAQPRETGYYTQPYGVSDRFAHPMDQSGFAPEKFYDRNTDMMSQSSHQSFDSAIDGQGAPQFTYMQVAQAQNLQATHFTAPASRGIHDPAGQQCPPGGKPRVSTTIWEDEGTLCFQVEARQVTVARREDNNMINGTKLLNVAQMSRGKRDGILKNEAVRSVIKVGSMHLKGVWIPFERALELANKNHVTDMLYPLFVKDIKKFLYHPDNYARTTAVLAAANHRQAQNTQPPGVAPIPLPDDRPMLDRSLSMPTPLDRSLSMLTPPSSASTTSDYWAGASMHGPISDTQARTHSLPGTPATTPPAPGYFTQNTQQTYTVPFSENRHVVSSGNHYGQQPDMQRSYNHSRNTSLMSYVEDDLSNESTHSLQPGENFGAFQPRIPSHLASGPSQMPDHVRYQQVSYGRPTTAQEAQNLGSGQSVDPRLAPATPGHHRSHSRSQSKGSVKIFNTPNLTTQMSRRVNKASTDSPVRMHGRHASRDMPLQHDQASLWVQQQQQLSYATPQQMSRGHVRQMSGQLPHIYEETPSCRMAYQLHGQARLGEQYPRHADGGTEYQPLSQSPLRAQHPMDGIASPLNGKKKRERVVSDSETYFHANTLGQEERQESLTPPPILCRDDFEESPKRRRSERTGMHSRSGSVF